MIDNKTNIARAIKEGEKLSEALNQWLEGTLTSFEYAERAVIGQNDRPEST